MRPCPLNGPRCSFMAACREQAERVIVEILRQADTAGLGKTLLFKAFWLAHLYYAKNARGYLSDWKIVRMPNGPGIDDAEGLIDDLLASGAIVKNHVRKGPYTEINCRLVDAPEGDLSEDAIEAIRSAVADVKKYSASEISALSHDFSRSWNNTQNGEELNIYSDLIPDDEYDDQAKEVAELKNTYESLFG